MRRASVVLDGNELAPPTSREHSEPRVAVAAGRHLMRSRTPIRLPSGDAPRHAQREDASLSNCPGTNDEPDGTRHATRPTVRVPTGLIDTTAACATRLGLSRRGDRRA